MRQAICYNWTTLFSDVIHYDKRTSKDLVYVEFSMRIIRRHIAIQFDNGPKQVNLNYIRPDNVEHTMEYIIWSKPHKQLVRTHDGKQLQKESYKISDQQTQILERNLKKFRGTLDKLLKL